MGTIIYILISILILGLFYYSKLAPYKDRLHGNYQKSYDVICKIIAPILKLIGRIAKPVQVGVGIQVDTTQLIFLLILLLLLKYIQ